MINTEAINKSVDDFQKTITALSEIQGICDSIQEELEKFKELSLSVKATHGDIVVASKSLEDKLRSFENIASEIETSTQEATAQISSGYDNVLINFKKNLSDFIADVKASTAELTSVKDAIIADNQASGANLQKALSHTQKMVSDSLLSNSNNFSTECEKLKTDKAEIRERIDKAYERISDTLSEAQKMRESFASCEKVITNKIETVSFRLTKIQESIDELNKMKSDIDRTKLFATIGMISGCVAAIASVIGIIL